MGRVAQMSSRRLLALLVLSVCASTVTYTTYASSIPVGVGAASFKPCKGGLECGYIIAPKNYLDAGDGMATINVIRKRASSVPSKGTVFVNPGGPGVGGVRWVTNNIERLENVIGSQWDIVGFDPRGIGSTTPRVRCFADPHDQITLYSDTVFEQGYTMPNMLNHSDPANFHALVPQQRQHLEVFKSQSESCHRHMNVSDLRFMGSTTVARDVDFMATVLDGSEAKINFYGYSYGTVIGSYIINMFPDRVGHITLDGVVDPITVSHVPTHLWAESFTHSADGSYDWFLRDCSKAGPELCPLAHYTREPPSAIGTRISTFTQSLVSKPLAVSGPVPGYLTAGAIRNLFVNALYSPMTWPDFARQLAAAMGPAGNGTELLAGLQEGIVGETYSDLARFAVICADAPRNSKLTPEDYARATIAALGVSRFASGLIFTDPDGGCEFWPVEPIERFTGPFNATLSHPVLIVSNTQDPVTPLLSGMTTNARMAPNSSTLVIQNGPGHTSLAMASKCTSDNIRAYWAGYVPANGTVCQLSETPWDQWWASPRTHAKSAYSNPVL